MRTNDHKKEPNIGEIKWLNSNEEKEKYANDIWNILQISYEKIGGLKSHRNFNDFKRKSPIVKIVATDNSILACATYRKLESSLKMTAIGCDQTDIGKRALQQIVQEDITSNHLHCWVEVSGAIEHFLKKRGNYPIPNIMAGDILGINDNSIKRSSNDTVHYSRSIKPNNEMFEKMMYGFKSKDSFEKTLKYIDDYECFMKEADNITETHSNEKYSLKQCYYIIDNIYRLHEEDGYNELLPSWHQALLDTLSVLKNCNEQTETTDNYIDYATYLLEDMPVLTVNELHIGNK